MFCFRYALHLIQYERSMLLESSYFRGCPKRALAIHMHVWIAERDVTGLCCPLELRSILADSFKQTDEDLLQYLRSKSCFYAQDVVQDEMICIIS